MHRLRVFLISSTALAFFVCVSASAADWTNGGGNATHDCLSTEVGPQSPAVLWSGSRLSIYAWQPVTEGDRVYMVRQNDFPPAGTPNDATIVCQNLTTGLEEWHVDLPFSTGEWSTWIAGVSQGRVYASRSGNNGTPTYWANLRCYDSATGAPLWTSTDVIDAGQWDGAVFAPNGDPVIGGRTMIWRIDHLTGSTVWAVSRITGSSNGFAVAIAGNAVYGAQFDQFGSGTTIRRYDLATGAFQYESGSLGAGNSNPPMIGPDGTIYKHGGGAPNQYVYFVMTDTGTAIVPKWNVPAGPTAHAEGGVGPDGSIYHFALNNEIHRLDPATGATLNVSAPLPVDPNSPTIALRFAIDSQGTMFLTNGEGQTGILASFNADLTPRWSIPWPSANIGGPVLGRNGTLLMGGIDMNVVAFRDSGATPFCFGDGTGTACPCANSGAVGNGCASSINPTGALLQASGIPSVSADSLVLTGSGMPNAASLYFQGTGQQGGGSGSVFGDGLRCAAGTIRRLGTKLNVAGASQYPTGTDQ